jgi:feruloyl esterase
LPGTSKLPDRTGLALRLLPALAALLLTGAAPAGDRCTMLARLEIPSVTIESAGSESSVCRVRGVARPTPSSHIVFELWMPVSGWNGRYYQLGNGGFAGNIDLPALAAEALRGNAAAMTDTGHAADRFDASWAAGHPDRIVDYGHRSVKATSDAARILVRAYYGRSARWRYFAGCSNGGRQALMAAQLYPDDWDGVIAGAPANRWTTQLTAFARLQHHLRASPENWLPAGKLPSIQRFALAACRRGTVVEGVATDPELCPVDVARLICRRVETANCLTPAQAQSLRLIVAAGYLPTSAALPDNWTQWILNPDPTGQSQLAFADGAFRYLLQDRPDWSVLDFDPRRDAPSAAISRTLDAEDPGFDRFRRRGGRIISYFGWADAVISPMEGLRHYRRVERRAGGSAQARLFYRLFMVPGMTHCQGGEGSTSFGQSIAAPAITPDPGHDIRAALESWVERQKAPDLLIATGRNSLGLGRIRTLRPAR